MSKRFYWLKLKDDFFDNEKIKIIESMENGKDYVLFLLKLQVKSIRNVGHLRLNADIPYNEQMLATITNTNIDIVRSAIKVLQQTGLLQVLDDGTYFMTKVAELTGSEVDSAERVRQHRARIESDKQQTKALPSNINVTKSNTDIELELDQELKKEKDKEIEILTQLFYDNIIKNINPTVWKKKPPKLEQWYDDIEKMHRIDGLDYSLIKDLINFATTDNFWKSNILSGFKLREKASMLEAKMKKSKNIFDRKQPTTSEIEEYIKATGGDK